MVKPGEQKQEVKHSQESPKQWRISGDERFNKR
nr:MAG TPA: hypothetical protein [Caudoviricetes sp.]